MPLTESINTAMFLIAVVFFALFCLFISVKFFFFAVNKITGGRKTQGGRDN